jgi:outer membrane protein assembly factor BamB
MKRTLFILWASAAVAQNWPSFRGPNASGVADGANAPTSWDAAKSVHVKWKTAIPGLGHSSPVVWGDRIFVTTAVSSDPKSEFKPHLEMTFEPAKDVSVHSWRVYCLDKNSGKILWERTAHTGVPKTKRHPTGSHASATPATDGRQVVAFFGSEGLYAYDFNGKLLWKQDVGLVNPGFLYDPDFEWGSGSSPILHKNLAIVQCDKQKDSFLAAYDLKDGRRVWHTPREELSSWSTPTVHQGKNRAELIASGRNIRGYDPMTGEQLWKLSGNAEYTIATPVVAHDLIFINDGYGMPVVQPFYAIRLGSNGDISLPEGARSSARVAWTMKRGGQWSMTTPLVYGDLLYTCSNNGIVACYNARSGERVYHERIGGKGGGYTASPVAADGKVYFTSEDGEIFVIRAGPKYEQLAANPMGETCMATPAISDGMIFVRTQSNLYGIGETKAKRGK